MSIFFVACYAILTLFLPHVLAAVETNPVPSGPQCETTYTIIYDNPTKFDEEKTVDVLKQNLSNIDFSADVLGGHHWWDYLQISKPDANSTSSLTIPTMSISADKIVRETMQGMDGVLRVDSIITTWCS